MEKVKYNFRKAELEQYRAVWLTKEAYILLRKQKKEQKKSLAKLVDELVKKNYVSVSKMPRK